MASKYRLKSSAFIRKGEDGTPQEPRSVFFLSVEGNDTEVEYFEQIEAHKKELGIDVLVKIEVLHRSKKDTNSAPKHVIELLEEYIELRETSVEEQLNQLLPEFTKVYSKEFVKLYLDKPEEIPKRTRKEFETQLTILGYDLNYNKYLEQYNGPNDKFCVVIDRDRQNHSEKNMRDCIEHCSKNNFLCFISNPCFEFWLLLHLSDVKIEYASTLDEIKKNEKKTDQHTYVSKIVSDKAGHGKSHINFCKNYLLNIDIAIERAKSFEIDINKLIDNVGTNLGELITLMRS